jgi:hypothetical protein
MVVQDVTAYRRNRRERLVMEIPHAPLRDLRSTGYFFDELKGYSSSPDMDLTTYCKGFVSPYLVKVSESHDRLGHPDKSRILKLAIKHLSDPSDDEIVDSIFGLRKVAVSEANRAGTADFAEQLDKSESLANKQKLQSAQFLVKLLVNVIRMFRLVETNANQKQAELTNPVFSAIFESWGVLENKSS